MDEEAGECCFDDWVDHWSKQSKRKPIIAGVTAHLLRALEGAGIRDRSVLDVGCGIGDLAIEAVRHGAARAYGVELSAKAVEEARRLAVERRVADRTSFEVADGSKMRLPNADVVVLNRVFCCYRDAEALLENSLSAAGSVYAFTTPPSKGLGGAFVRVQAGSGTSGTGSERRSSKGSGSTSTTWIGSMPGCSPRDFALSDASVGGSSGTSPCTRGLGQRPSRRPSGMGAQAPAEEAALEAGWGRRRGVKVNRTVPSDQRVWDRSGF